MQVVRAQFAPNSGNSMLNFHRFKIYFLFRSKGLMISLARNPICDMHDWFYLERWLRGWVSSNILCHECRAKFSDVRFEIVNSTSVKCSLEINLASTVQSRIVLYWKYIEFERQSTPSKYLMVFIRRLWFDFVANNMEINVDFEFIPLFLLRNEKLQGTAYEKRHSTCFGGTER